MWEPRRLASLWVSTACYKNDFTFLPLINVAELTLDVLRNDSKETYDETQITSSYN
jgi:hypothetical protein